MTFHKRFTSQLIRDGLTLTVTKLAGLPISLAVMVLLSRNLGAEAFGRYTFLVSLVSILVALFCGAFPSLLTRELVLARRDQDWGLVAGIIRRTNQFTIIASMILITLYYIYFGLYKEGTGEFHIIHVLLIPAMSYTIVGSGVLRGLGEIQKSQISSLLLLPTVQLILLIFINILEILTLKNSIITIVIAYIVACAIQYRLLLKAFITKVTAARPEYKHKLWAKSWLSLTGVIIATHLNGQVNVLILGLISNDFEIAMFQVADKFAQFASLPLGLIDIIIANQFAQLYKAGSLAQLQVLAQKSSRLTLLLMLPIAISFILLGDSIINLVFGTEYGERAHISLTILAAAQIINVAMGSVGVFLTMTNNENSIVTGQIIALTINITLSFLLIPMFGSEGAAIAAACGIITWNLILSWRIYVIFKIRVSAI